MTRKNNTHGYGPGTGTVAEERPITRPLRGLGGDSYQPPSATGYGRSPDENRVTPVGIPHSMPRSRGGAGRTASPRIPDVVKTAPGNVPSAPRTPLSPTGASATLTSATKPVRRSHRLPSVSSNWPNGGTREVMNASYFPDDMPWYGDRPFRSNHGHGMSNCDYHGFDESELGRSRVIPGGPDSAMTARHTPMPGVGGDQGSRALDALENMNFGPAPTAGRNLGSTSLSSSALGRSTVTDGGSNARHTGNLPGAMPLPSGNRGAASSQSAPVPHSVRTQRQPRGLSPFVRGQARNANQMLQIPPAHTTQAGPPNLGMRPMGGPSYGGDINKFSRSSSVVTSFHPNGRLPSEGGAGKRNDVYDFSQRVVGGSHGMIEAPFVSRHAHGMSNCRY